MIEYLPLVLTGIGIIVSILYYTSVLRNAEKTRRAQLVSRLREMFWSLESGLMAMELLEMEWRDFEDFDAKYDSTVNPENYAKRFMLWGQLQEVGYLLHEGIVDVETVYNLWGGHNSLLMWEKFKPIILEQRKKYRDPSWFVWFEFLAEEIKKYRKKQGISPEIFDADGYITHSNP